MGVSPEDLKEWAKPIIEEKAREAIELQINGSKNKKKGVVQKTGWGSYLVSFVTG